MDTLLLVNISGNTFQQLDIFEDITISLTIQQNDLVNLNQRRAPYSKTIQIPDTDNNAKILEHYYEINGVDFNPLQKISAIVQYRGTNIFEGVMRLNSVISLGEERIYEIFLLGEISDWASFFRDFDLQDLDYTDLNHIQEYSAITQSWEATGNNDGLFGGKILYPMINYGLEYGGVGTAFTPSFKYSFGEAQSFDQPGFAVPERVWKPAIQIKDVLDRIFALTPYEIVSDFFETDYFKAIYMDTFQNGQIGVESASAITNQNIFLAQYPLLQLTYNNGFLFDFPLFDNFPGSFDPLNNYTNVVNPLSSSDRWGYFRAPYGGQYSWNLRFNVKLNDPATYNPLFPAKIAIFVYAGSDVNFIQNGTLIYQSPDINLNQAFFQQLPVNLYFSATLNPGDNVQVFIRCQTPRVPLGFSSNAGEYTLLPYSEGGITENLIKWELYDSPTIGTNLIDMRIGIPNMRAIDFVKSLITLFNLIVVQEDNTKTIRIEPYNWYFNDPIRPRRDFTDILDLNSQIKIEPLSYDLSKDAIWTYKNTDNEYLPKTFFDRYNYVFGREKYSTLDNVFVGESIYEVSFGSCPTSGITNAPNFIIPQYFYLINGQETPYSKTPHLFFWVGNRWAYKDQYKSQQGTWYMYSGSTAVPWTTYPCVSHLSFLDSQLPNVLSDLNFSSSFDFFGFATNQIQQFTPYTLTNTFWQPYVDNIYSPETKRLSGKFYYRPIDVYETKLNDKVWIKDAWFSIEKITDADLVNKRLTDITLIKEKLPYYKITPPAPVYVLQPNAPYPSPQAFYSTSCYVSFDQGEVCSGTTSGLTTIYSFGPPTLENFDQVYIDTGTSYQLVPIGTYIRQQTSSTTFVVIDIYGRILEQTC